MFRSFPPALLVLVLLLGGGAGRTSEGPARGPRGPAALAAHLGTPAAGEAVADALSALEPDDPEAACELAHALGHAGGSHAAGALAVLAAHRDEAVRLAALRSATHLELRLEALTKECRRSLRSRSPRERTAAVRALARIGDGRDVPRLLELAASESASAAVREAAFDALRRLGGARIPSDASRWRAWWRDLDRRDRSDLDRALSALTDPTSPHPALHRAVLHRRAWLDLVGVREIAQAWLRGPETHLRAEACRLVTALRLADLASDVESARAFDLRRGYRADADQALRAVGWVPETRSLRSDR